MKLRNVISRTIIPAIVSVVGFPVNAMAEDALTEFRIGYQKNGTLVAARQQQKIETALEEKGISVKWVEFSSGPPLLEAVNVGSIDFGTTGDTPPIFAQAAGANIVYVATQPSPGTGSAILVHQDSEIQTLSDLKGKKVGFTKGSSANNLTVEALIKGGLTYNDIEPVYLSPADATAAFVRKSIDAWTIWDPYYAIAETKQNARVLTTGEPIVATNSFLLANGDFARKHPDTVSRVIAALSEAANWAEANRDKVAEALAEVTGVDLQSQTLAAERASFGIYPISQDIIQTQQTIADRFYEIGLIPKKITIRDAIWNVPQS